MLRARDEARIRRTVILSVFAVSVYLGLDRLAGFVHELETGEDPSVVGLLTKQGLIYAAAVFGMIAAAPLLKVIDRAQRRRREEAEAEASTWPAPPEDLTGRGRLEAYLRSDEWWARRSDALAQAGHRCEECLSPRELVVLHRCYDRVGDERPEDLSVVCGPCYQPMAGRPAYVGNWTA